MSMANDHTNMVAAVEGASPVMSLRTRALRRLAAVAVTGAMVMMPAAAANATEVHAAAAPKPNCSLWNIVAHGPVCSCPRGWQVKVPPPWEPWNSSCVRQTRPESGPQWSWRW